MPDIRKKFLTIKKLCMLLLLFQYHLVEFVRHSLLNIVYGLLMWQTNKCTFINMFNHILLFSTNIFQSPSVWPSPGCLITRIQ